MFASVVTKSLLQSYEKKVKAERLNSSKVEENLIKAINFTC
jgi:hypothetical protein